MTANSGERFNIIAVNDINLDGFTGSDNPVGIRRNSGVTPYQFNTDLRYSRFFNFNERLKLEAFGEFLNVFNINSKFQINSLTVTTDALGNLTQALPTVQNRPVTSLDSRQFQVGFKFIFLVWKTNQRQTRLVVVSRLRRRDTHPCRGHFAALVFLEILLLNEGL
ncbi:MAG: hypothetical protein IPN69_00070 [Acidobacteria bacterium]|nr:hypothetical protein [Acidobacteriota bacterium]